MLFAEQTELIYQKCLTESMPNHSTMVIKSTENHPKFVPNPWKLCPAAFWGRSWGLVGWKTIQRWRCIIFGMPFWRHVGDFGCCFGSSQRQANSQIEHFSTKCVKDVDKKGAQNRRQNKYGLLTRLESKYEWFRKCCTLWNAWFISIWVVFADQDKIEIERISDGKSMPKLSLKSIKIELGGAVGSILEVFRCN